MMTTHSGHAYLNTCVKVPIDPCNNCPAPIYNRPKIYLGRLANATISVNGRAKMATATSLEVHECEDELNESDSTWSNTGIKSLAKFYDSIPDYCEVNHLPEAEFYSTLESLRTTSRELRTQSKLLETCGSASTTSLSTYCGLDKVKTKKKRQNSAKSANKKKNNTLKSIKPVATCSKLNARCAAVTPTTTVTDDYTKCLRGLSRLNNFKEEFAAEVADFKRTLKSYEQEFKRPTSGCAAERPKSTCSSTAKLKAKSKEEQKPNFVQAKVEEPSQTLSKRETLRKSYSVNDLSLMHEHITSAPPKSKNLVQTHVYRSELSKYFPPKRTVTSELPKVVVDSPTTSSKRSSSASCRTRCRKTTKTRKCMPAEKPPFTIFQLSSPKHTSIAATPSPVHPVARPNLAATLREEVARRKVKELKNNCTYHDTTPQVDWEVRKTPAWKSLALNEPHKAILSIRLATRKAEQALQQHQYELHMEMMRQRVKSAPLLLEGSTYWGPDVGKLSHTCQREGTRHMCESKQRKQRKKSGGHSSRCTTANNSTCVPVGDWHAAGGEQRDIGKMQQLRKIYGSSAKCASRNSQRSTSGGKRTGRCRRAEEAPTLVDSGDDLCSVDRAFL